MARSRPHVKVHLSVQHHERTAEIWADAAERGMLVELWRTGVEQYAPKRGGRVELMPLDRLRIAGNPPPSIENPVQSADDAVELLCKKLGYRLDKRPNRWTVTVRKFARKQGIGDPELPTKADSLSHERTPQRAEAEAEAESREQKGETSDVPSSLDSLSPAEEIWGQVNSTLRAYMPRKRELVLSDKRRKSMLKVEEDFGAGSAVGALNGYAALYLTKEPNGWDPLPTFTPDTCWRAANVGKYLDANNAAEDLGLMPPYLPPDPQDEERERFEWIMGQLQGRV